MRVLVTGSSGHLGEALVRTLVERGYEVAGLAGCVASPFTHPRRLDHGLRPPFRRAMAGARWVFHTATLHKPHVATHSRQEFVDVNVTGTLNLLEEASAAGVEALVCTSTTSTFGDALVPPAGEPAAWITEAVRPVPTNIYGVTKTAAEDLCQLFHRNQGLRASCTHFALLPGGGRHTGRPRAWDDTNLKVNELLYTAGRQSRRRQRATLGGRPCAGARVRRYIVSATTPVPAGGSCRTARRRAGDRRPARPGLGGGLRAGSAGA